MTSPEREQAEARAFVKGERVYTRQEWDALVERAEKAERRANHHREEYDLIRAEASRKIEAAVERERELTRALEAIASGKEMRAHEDIAREALAGGVSAAGRPPEQDLGGNAVAVAEALRRALVGALWLFDGDYEPSVDEHYAWVAEANTALTAATALKRSHQEVDAVVPAAPEVLPEETR